MGGYILEGTDCGGKHARGRKECKFCVDLVRICFSISAEKAACRTGRTKNSFHLGLGCRQRGDA